MTHHGTFYVIKTKRGFLAPYEKGTFRFTEDLNRAVRYKTAGGATQMYREMFERFPSIRVVPIRATYEEQETVDAREMFHVQIEQHDRLQPKAVVDPEAMADGQWKRYRKLNRTLANLGLVERHVR